MTQSSFRLIVTMVLITYDVVDVDACIEASVEVEQNPMHITCNFCKQTPDAFYRLNKLFFDRMMVVVMCNSCMKECMDSCQGKLHPDTASCDLCQAASGHKMAILVQKSGDEVNSLVICTLCMTTCLKERAEEKSRVIAEYSMERTPVPSI